MIDGRGRNIDYIRISVTDRCNLRCVYCMPEEGVESISHERILRFQEIVRIVRILAAKGIRKIKLTGGEPLVRKGIAELIAELKQIEGIENVTITTNGVLLEEMYDELVDAGLDAITVSLDTLNREIFQQMTRRDEAERVKRGIEKAIRENRVPLKINCVPVLGWEEQQLEDLLDFARMHKVHIRFIEMMPIGLGSGFPFVSEEVLREKIEAKFGPLTPCTDVEGNGPCHYFAAEGLQGRIGFISALSHQFCDSCNRIRLTAEGFLKTCLQYDSGAELKPLLNSGCSDAELAEAVEQALREKPASHSFRSEIAPDGREKRSMSQIGG